MPDCPALLFDDIKGFPRGFRIFTNAVTNPQRAALALGLDPALRPLDALKAWMEKRKTLQPHEPVPVQDAPFLANTATGRRCRPRQIPGAGLAPPRRRPVHRLGLDRHHARSGRRLDQCLDLPRPGARPEQGDRAVRPWRTARRDHREEILGPGQDAARVAVVNGEDPALFIAGFEYLPAGQSEYEFAGAIKGAPIEIVAGPQTGLPVPAHAEIVFEGHLLPMSEMTLPEGPFGEFTGYYAAEARPGPVMEVTATYHRDDPILLGSPPMKPPRFHFGLPFRAATIWQNLEAAGVTDVVGAWQHVSQLMTVVAIRQRYDGHAKRAALVAAAHSYMARVVVVVDDDVDPSNLADVMWAVTTRCEPSEQVDIVRNAWSSALDPRISPDDKARGITSHSKLIIEACRPFPWIDKFPPASALTLDEARAIEEKWGGVLKGAAQASQRA